MCPYLTAISWNCTHVSNLFEDIYHTIPIVGHNALIWSRKPSINPVCRMIRGTFAWRNIRTNKTISSCFFFFACYDMFCHNWLIRNSNWFKILQRIKHAGLKISHDRIRRLSITLNHSIFTCFLHHEKPTQVDHKLITIPPTKKQSPIALIYYSQNFSTVEIIMSKIGYCFGYRLDL